MLTETLLKSLSDGLLRKSSIVPSKWAENYIILGKPVAGAFKFDRHPWSREWLDYNGSWGGMKAAQMAMSTAAIIRALHTVDIKRNDVLYVLPKKNPDVTDFSKGKFDVLLDLSPHLQNLFSSVRNVGHKQAGNVNLYFRGSRSRSGLKAISAGVNIFDELDEMAMKQVSLAQERASGYEDSDNQEIYISTPTIPEFGIHAVYETGSKEHYFFNCPRCSKFIEFKFPECLIVTADRLDDEEGLKKSHLICPECHGIIQHSEKAEAYKSAQWVPERKSSFRTFYINQLYSTLISPIRLAKSALKARLDEAEDQEFWNSKGGLPRVLEGARVNDLHLTECISSYQQPYQQPGLVTMGVDVGHKVLFVHIDRWLLPQDLGNDLNTFALKQNLYHVIVNNFEELEPLLSHFQVNHTVVDVDPAFRSAIAFAQKHEGLVTLCRFTKSTSKKSFQLESDNPVAQVNRTYWLDLSQGRYRTKKILLPQNTLPEYKEHIKAPVRHQKKDDEGNIISRYITPPNKADHFAFAGVYSEIALPLAVSNSENTNIKAFL